MREYMRLEVIAPIEPLRAERTGDHLRQRVEAWDALIFQGPSVRHGQFVPSKMLMAVERVAAGITLVGLL